MKSKRMGEITVDIHASVPDNQILLSFNTDEDAELFWEWWQSDGQQLFSAACEDTDGTE